MALLVWPNHGEEKNSLTPPSAPVGKVSSASGLCEEGGQAGSPAPSPMASSASQGDSKLDWCRPFLCRGTVWIAGSQYPVTVLRDTGAQQSVCRNVTGGTVTTTKAVLCRGLNTVEEYGTAEVTLSCPLLTTTACVVVADDLPVAGVDFLLGNDLAGGKVWVPNPPCSEESRVGECAVQESREAASQLQAGQLAEGVRSRGADRGDAGLPQEGDCTVAAGTRGAVRRASGPPQEGCSKGNERVGRVRMPGSNSAVQSKVAGRSVVGGVGGANCERVELPPIMEEVQALTPTAAGSSEGVEELVPETVSVVTRSQTRKGAAHTPDPATRAVVPESRKQAGGVARSAGATPSLAEGSGAGLPTVASDPVGVAEEGEDDGFGLVGLFAGSCPPSEHPRGDTGTELSPVMKAEGTDVHSRPQSGWLDGQLGVVPQGGEASDSAGEVEVSPPVGSVGGQGDAAPWPGDRPAGAGPGGTAPKVAAEVEGTEPPPRLPRRTGLRVAALPQPLDSVVPPYFTHLAPGELVRSQQGDSDLAPYFARVGEGSEEVDGCEEFVLHQGVLCRRWRESDGGEFLQVVVPRPLREALVLLAHAGPMAGHLGVRKTVARLRRNFWWPSMAGEVSTVLKGCHTYHVVGKPNQAPPLAPLHPIPAVDPPFTRVLIDVVGPLPPTRAGHKYLLTIMDLSTRYPEAVPLRSVHTKFVIKALLNFFTHFGLPREVQSDQGTNFTSKLFEQTMAEWGITHVLCSAYHPQSQGALERHHQTLKNMLRTFCYERDKDWDEAVPYVLFAVREAPTESLGFSPNELVFGHRVRGPLDVVRESWCCPQDDPPVSLLQGVLASRERLAGALQVARDNLGEVQKKMKGYYDRKVKYRSFEPGEEVLALLPLQGQPLAARYSGPYVVESRVGDLDYMIATPDRRKRAQLCHVNMLKPYVRSLPRVGSFSSAVEEAPLVLFCRREGEDPEFIGPEPVVPTGQWEKNSLTLLAEKLSHLPRGQRKELLERLGRYPSVFSSAPGRTHLIAHDIDVGEAAPVKLPPYRVNPEKQRLVEKELEYMLSHGLVERAYSQWSSPITLQPKSDGKVRFCINVHKVNALTAADIYPLPRVDDSVDRIGAATFTITCDLVEGYWEMPLAVQAKEIASYVADRAMCQAQARPEWLCGTIATFCDNCVLVMGCGQVPLMPP